MKRVVIFWKNGGSYDDIFLNERLVKCAIKPLKKYCSRILKVGSRKIYLLNEKSTDAFNIRKVMISKDTHKKETKKFFENYGRIKLNHPEIIKDYTMLEIYQMNKNDLKALNKKLKGE